MADGTSQCDEINGWKAFHNRLNPNLTLLSWGARTVPVADVANTIKDRQASTPKITSWLERTPEETLNYHIPPHNRLITRKRTAFLLGPRFSNPSLRYWFILLPDKTFPDRIDELETSHIAQSSRLDFNPHLPNPTLTTNTTTRQDGTSIMPKSFLYLLESDIRRSTRYAHLITFLHNLATTKRCDLWTSLMLTYMSLHQNEVHRTTTITANT